MNKVVQTANVELVRLYLGKSVLTDHLFRDVRVDGNVSSLIFCAPTSLSADIPENPRFCICKSGCQSYG
ncbi:hypothetical protein [Pedobacter terrae]|uniref:hypothetical protein n=1 Tax=Pedobacter terrae TaxID=405671 RepID=UPI003FA6A00A